MNDKQLHVDVTLSGHNVAVIDLKGEIDIYTAPEFQSALTHAIEEGFRRVVVDVSKVTFMDSTGLGVFVGGQRKMHLCDGLLVVVCTDPTITRIFQITGLADVFTFRETRNEALKVATDWP